MPTPESNQAAIPTGKQPVNPASSSCWDAGSISQLKRFGLAALLIAGCFSVPLYQWADFALHDDLFSYVLLIPAIPIYLCWTSKEKPSASSPALPIAAAFGVAAVVVLGLYWTLIWSNHAFGESDRLSVVILSFVLFIWSACAAFLGRSFLRLAAFPIAFLVFMVPLPTFAENALSSFLQHASAEVSYWMIKLAGTPVLRENTTFVLPGITINVAPECSGIRSSIVLFLTSLLASHFFLKRFWTRSILVAAVIVLGIFRNALRIFTIVELCVHISPTMIDSPIHHRGGPVFFIISLAPLLFVIWYLRKLESKKDQGKF